MNGNESSRGPGFGHLFLALLGGAVAGAAAAYLTAPRSGAESRRRIHDLAEDTRDTVGRVPEALRRATLAARNAFNEALQEEAKQHGGGPA